MSSTRYQTASIVIRCSAIEIHWIQRFLSAAFVHLRPLLVQIQIAQTSTVLDPVSDSQSSSFSMLSPITRER